MCLGIVLAEKDTMALRVWRGVRDYLHKLRFQRNAWLYLLSTILTGVAFGIYRLLFNFYVTSLNYDAALVGNLVSVSSLAALFGAFPAGYLCDRLGRKLSLLLSGAMLSASVIGIVLWHNPPGFYLMNVLSGLAQALTGVTSGPFLMENSGDQERTYLFSFNAGVQTIAASVGNWGGGQLPTWLGGWLGVSAVSATAYGWSIAVVGATSLLALLPLALLRQPQLPRSQRPTSLSPFQFLVRQPVLLFKLLAPQGIIALGAGLLMPFLNLFFRSAYSRSDAEIGTLFAFGSLSMGLGLLAAPPLAERWGKMRFVIFTQALSIPFLIMLGFSPQDWYGLAAAAYLIRVALMNMSSPVYQTFMMEQVGPEARATVAGLNSVLWNAGWFISPLVSGLLQVSFGFTPVFLGTIGTYVIAIVMMWFFFWRAPQGGRPAVAPALADPPDLAGQGHD
jgi:MFS family permease